MESSEARNLVRDLSMPADEHSTLGGRDVLHGIKRKTTCVPKQANMGSAVTGAHSKGTVLDNFQASALGESKYFSHVAWNTDEMHHGDGARLRRNCPGDFFWGYISRDRIAVHKHRLRTHPFDGVSRRYVSLSRHNHFVTRPYSERQIRQVQGSHTRAYGNACSASDECCEFLFELLAFRSMGQYWTIKDAHHSVLVGIGNPRAAKRDR